MLRFEVACGLKTLTSKKVRSYRLPQRPLAAMSRWAPSWVFADTPDSCSLVMGCRCGSTLTSLHTSDIRLAVRSRILLCLIDGNPPLGQESACSTENGVPQSQLVGMRESCHPYLKHKASRNTPLCRVKSNSDIGRAVNQLEPPFS